MSPLVSTTTPLPNSPSAARTPPTAVVALGVGVRGRMAVAAVAFGVAPLAGDGLLVANLGHDQDKRGLDGLICA